MKIVLMLFAREILRLIYIPFSFLKTRPVVTMISRQSDDPSVDFRLLKEYLNKKGQPVNILCKKLNKNLSGGLSYSLHMLKQMYHIASSQVIILDGYCILASILPKKKGQQIVQIWHSLGAIKKFGYQTIGKADGNRSSTSKIMELHRNYDWIIAPSEATGKFFAEAFGYDEEKIKLLPLPRIDYIKSEKKELNRQIKRTYPSLGNKDTVLYAPTFRKGSRVDADVLTANFDFKRYNLVIKKHPLDKMDYSSLQQKGAIVDKRFSSMDWLGICNKVISDYSGIIFESAILRKEIYIYIYDISQYKEKTGLNIDFAAESLARYCYVDPVTMGEDMKQKYDLKLVDRFREKYITVDTCNCTAKLGDFIISIMEETNKSDELKN